MVSFGWIGLGREGENKPMQIIVPLSCMTIPSPSRACPHSRTIFAIFSSNGSANPTCPTIPFSKKVKGRTPITKKLHISTFPPFKSKTHGRKQTLSSVNNLIRHDKIPRLDLLSQTSNSTKGNNSSNPNTSQRGNVRTIGNLMRRNLMV